MRRGILAVGIIVASLGWILPAAAREGPLTVPTRDVMVTYRATAPVQGREQQREVRVAITAGGAMMRVEGMGGASDGAYVIVNRKTQRMTMVLPQDRRYLDLPANDVFARGFLLNDSMTFVRGRGATVAGLKCTEWQVTSDDGNGTVCVTADGVLLRGRGSGGRGGIVAKAVKYGRQPAALFKPPAGYSRLEAPGARPAPGK